MFHTSAIVFSDERSSECNVQVIMRPRPLNDLERTRAGDKECIRVVGDSVELLNSASASTDAPRYTFDKVLDPASSQQDVFELMGPKAVKGERLFESFGCAAIRVWLWHWVELASYSHVISLRSVFVYCFSKL